MEVGINGFARGGVGKVAQRVDFLFQGIDDGLLIADNLGQLADFGFHESFEKELGVVHCISYQIFFAI